MAELANNLKVDEHSAYQAVAPLIALGLLHRNVKIGVRDVWKKDYETMPEDWWSLHAKELKAMEPKLK